MKTIHVLLKKPKELFLPVNWFWYPMFIFGRELRDRGIRVRFFSKIQPNLGNCDSLFLESRFFHQSVTNLKERRPVLEQLRKFRKKADQVVWFDSRDSSGNPQFEVLPYVDLYLKKMLLVDLNQYRKKWYGNRLFSDFVHQKFGIEDRYDEAVEFLKPEYEHKIGLSWSLGLADNRLRPGLRKLFYPFRDWLEVSLGMKRNFPMIPFTRERDVDLVALFRYVYDRNTVSFQRTYAREIISGWKNKKVIQGGPVSNQKYREAFLRAKCVLTLFGWGELCFRDFEAFFAGSALIGPDVSHFRTWPTFHFSKETYWPIQWDLSDLEESVDYLLSHEKLRSEIAAEGQHRYSDFWTNGGGDLFAERVLKIIQGKKPSLPSMKTAPKETLYNQTVEF